MSGPQPPSSAQGGSLRDLYSSPSTSWAFLPASSNNGATSADPSGSSSSSITRQWSARPSSNNPVFDLSPSIDLSDSGNPINLKAALKLLLASAFLRYTTTAIAMPWEVSKLLLQVQWIPKEEVGEDPSLLPAVEDSNLREDEAEMSDTSSTDDTYFHDPSQSTASRWGEQVTPTRARPADDQGYVLRASVHEDATRPDYILPVGPSDGVWGMIKRLLASRTEGWLSLWKGLLTSCLHDMLHATIQPFLHDFLQPVSPTSGSILVPVVSHLATGILLSPLDLLRTRQIIHPRQSSPSPFTLFSQILREEGGLKGIYFNPRLLIPTILDNSIRPLISLSLPGLIHQHLGLRDDLHPVAYPVVEFIGTSFGYLITLPIETIRRRLQVQSSGGQPVNSCVELRPRPYTGTTDTLWKILSEERSSVVRPAKKKGTFDAQGREEVHDSSEGLIARTGIGQLYRGLGMGVSAGFIVLVLALIAGGEEEVGWAEL